MNGLFERERTQRSISDVRLLFALLDERVGRAGREGGRPSPAQVIAARDVEARRPRRAMDSDIVPV